MQFGRKDSMENKKQLIIIPPMSEALKKLNEVLESVSTEENIEINIIDDLKELGQFLATTGQCLILASNAKKCATFLQDNKTMLAKFHCKTILFTPKEIPAKTLIKFTKVGLTESILESLPPKTFLYKVKLLLRSIKTSTAAAGELAVKSTDTNALLEDSTLEMKERIQTPDHEELPSDLDLSEKKKFVDSGETIDYGTNLKGKNKHKEESLDTNWKSDRKKNLQEEETSALEEEKETESAHEEIDMYYRGKNKKNTEFLPEEEENGFGKKRFDYEEAVGEKKRSSYSDVIDDGAMKEKRLEPEFGYEKDAKEKKKTTELDLIDGKKKRNDLTKEESEASGNLDYKMAYDREEGEKGKPQSDVPKEDLGGYLKGKLSNEKLTAEEAPILEEKMAYDNSELDDGKKSRFDLDLEAAKKEKNEKDAEGNNDPNKAHDGQVDQLESNMMGDAGTVEKIKTLMNSELDPDAYKEEPEDHSALNLFPKKSLDLDLEDPEKSRELMPEEDKKNRKSKTSNELASAEEKAAQEEFKPGHLGFGWDEEAEAAQAREEDSSGLDKKKLTELDLEKSKKSSGSTSKADEGTGMNLQSTNKNLDLEKDRNRAHEGQVDKINTFYRSTDSKKKDQDWDNLNQKNNTLDFSTKKARSADLTEKAQEKNFGENTIDYKKLKEEFEAISFDSTSQEKSYSTGKGTEARNFDDEGSFKVIEINPKSLDFSIIVVNAIFDKDIKPKKIFTLLAEEIINTYQGFPVFYSYKLSDKKFNEIFNPFTEINDERKMPTQKREWWHEFKNSNPFEHHQSKSMTTWSCPKMNWEDVEIPAWAEQELKDKHVELIFPYFDGIDRMGLAVVYFPEGINPKSVSGALTVLEMARTLFLDTIERYKVQPVIERDLKEEEAPVAEKKNVLSFFSGLFGKKKKDKAG
jgi:hypothetical protein